MTPTTAKPAWKVVCDTPAEVTPSAGEVYRLELPSRVCDTDLIALSSLTGKPIVRLDLSGCEQMSDAGLAHLIALTGLEHLNLYGCVGITDAGLTHLIGLTRLTRLDLTRCRQLTDDGLRHLAALPRLEHLSLGGCEWVTDAGLVHVAKVRSLKTVSLRGTQATDAGVERLRRAAPGCAVEV